MMRHNDFSGNFLAQEKRPRLNINNETESFRSKSAIDNAQRLPHRIKHDRPQKHNKWPVIVGTSLSAGALVAVSSISALATAVAKSVVTPPTKVTGTLRIFSTLEIEGEKVVVLEQNPDTVVPGVYSLVFSDGKGYARIGRIVDKNDKNNTVTRIVEKVYRGDLDSADNGTWTGSTFDTPDDLDLEYEEVMIPTQVGNAPAWLLKPSSSESSQSHRWAIFIHGWGSMRREMIRYIGLALSLSMNVLVVSYRNDKEAPTSDNGLYGLGATEWKDVESALDYAAENGAQEFVLFGNSMGGQIALQTQDQSKHKKNIRALVLDGPVVNWFDVFKYASVHTHIPYPIIKIAEKMFANKLGANIIGTGNTVDFSRMNWLERSDELDINTLIIHSVDDDLVPYESSRELATKNKNVTWVKYEKAKHCKEWNIDPVTWNNLVYQWLKKQLL